MTRSRVAGIAGFALMSVVATELCPVGAVVVVVVVEPVSFDTTSAGLSSLTGDAQPASTATLASASNNFPEFFIIVFSPTSTMNMAVSTPGAPALHLDQRPNGPQTGS